MAQSLAIALLLVATAATGAERLDASYFWSTIAPGAGHEARARGAGRADL